MAKFTPPSGKDHPPAAGAHSCGPMTDHGGGGNGPMMQNAVTRDQKTNPPPKK
jgi:hypothetical protein